MKFEKIMPGMTLYDVHSTRMGNTTMRTMGCWEVLIVSVDPDKRQAMARWNVINPPRLYFERDLKRLREKKPEFERVASGQSRIKRKPKAAPAERAKERMER